METENLIKLLLEKTKNNSINWEIKKRRQDVLEFCSIIKFGNSFYKLSFTKYRKFYTILISINDILFVNDQINVSDSENFKLLTNLEHAIVDELSRMSERRKLLKNMRNEFIHILETL